MERRSDMFPTEKRHPAGTTDRQAFASFVKDLRWVLRHLYDPGECACSPLLGLIAASPSYGAPELRRALVAAIEALKPTVQPPAQARAWRLYRILRDRYAEQFTSLEVAESLAIGQRQLERDENVAVRVLADYLWARHDAVRFYYADRTAEPVAGAPQSDRGPSREHELQWLQTSLASEVVAIGDVLQAVLQTLGPLLQANGARIQCSIAPNVPAVLVPAAVLRQSLLSALTGVVSAAAGRVICINVEADNTTVRIDVSPDHVTGAFTTALAQSESVDMARRLLTPWGGTLAMVTASGQQTVRTLRLSLPRLHELTVLVIEDNADTLRLYERYLQGSRYAFVGCRDPQQALALAGKLKPHIIVLDVMLPGTDGWDLLQRLRTNPATCHIPVIVSTILAEGTLAMAMGAAAFIRKPINQMDLLAVLDQQT